MRKYIILAFILTVTTIIAIAEDSKFINALEKCSSYSESAVVNTEGMNVQSKKSISGREGNKCVYKETVNLAGVNSTVTCKLTQPQINELTSVMKAYDLMQKYSNETVDTSSLSNMDNNPVVNVWNKYLQDPSTCELNIGR